MEKLVVAFYMSIGVVVTAGAIILALWPIWISLAAIKYLFG